MQTNKDKLRRKKKEVLDYNSKKQQNLKTGQRKVRRNGRERDQRWDEIRNEMKA